VTERPIILTGPEVEAVLAGRKTQLRRAVEPQPDPLQRGDRFLFHRGGLVSVDRYGNQMLLRDCPFGEPDDLLWVQEGWAYTTVTINGLAFDNACLYRQAFPDMQLDWQPAETMTVRQSRLWLRVESVRVERLSDISEDDALAEGLESDVELVRQYPGGEVIDYTGLYAVERFEDLWDSINGNRPGCSWEESPWVWALEFTQIEHSNNTQRTKR
jgi:hypothetical protein